MNPQDEATAQEEPVAQEQPTVRDVVRVTVKEPVRGMRRARGKGKRKKAKLDNHVVVVPEVMAAAKAAIRPNQKLVIESATVVRLVNR